MADTDGPAATEAAGAHLAQRLAPGDVVWVSGELGAGKTTFVRGALRALGVRGPVTSPTFTLAARYEGDVPVVHLLAGELDPDAVAFVEWPERGRGALPPATVRVRLEHLGGDRRRIAVR